MSFSTSDLFITTYTLSIVLIGYDTNILYAYVGTPLVRALFRGCHAALGGKGLTGNGAQEPQIQPINQTILVRTCYDVFHIVGLLR